jgi:broad specificity phosphatase PhoE
MEKIPQKQNKEMLFAGHLEDIDNLKLYGRNAPLVDIERNRDDLNKIVNAIISKVKKSNKKAVMLVTSPKIRAKETADLITTEIKKKSDINIKILHAIEDNLKAPEQGEIILPENYTPGSFFEGLKIASDIFFAESLNYQNQNLHYKFGDPVLKPDGSYKYPELVKYFKKAGETYAESLTRILTAVIKMGQKVEKLNSSVEVVLIAHGFTYEVLKGLSILAKRIKEEGVKIKIEEIPHKLSEIYESRTSKLRDTACAPLDITNLGDKELIDLLKKEIEFLEKNY